MIETYRAHASANAAARDREQERSILISRLRLATFLPGAAWLVWVLGHQVTPLALAGPLALLAVFAVLVFWHARVDERVAWFDALRVVNERAVARIERRWAGLPPSDPPEGVDLSHHQYALDLDLFGRASLSQWIGPAATPHGARRLHGWLLSPAEPEQIRGRQPAVAELADGAAWREGLAAHGILAAGARTADLDRILTWSEGPPPFRRGAALHAATLVLTAAIWTLGALHFFGTLDRPLWLIPVTLGMVLSFATARVVHGAFDRAGAGQRAIGRYAGMLEHAVNAPARAPLLRELQTRLSAEGKSAPRCMRQLNRILGFAELRSGAAILHFPVQALTLWDLHIYFALERWRTHVGARVRDWLAALADLDALSALARIRHDNPSWCVPEVSATATVTARGLGHPLLRDERRVVNDVDVGPPGAILLVTGSNMSGKSTLLRSIGLNIVLAQAGANVCASSFTPPPSDLQTSIRVQDSLELGLSYFMAALARLKGVVDSAEHERPGRVLVYLLDEILQGTNTAERSIAVRGVARHLLQAGAIGVMTTHDLGLASEEPLDRAAKLIHFTETVDEQGNMSFDYRLRDGLATSRNALRLMKLIGLDL